jgi:hypothetical protein
MTTTQTEVKGGGWWVLPEAEREAILAAMPDQDEWTFTATRVSDLAWSIDVPEAGTYGELLVGGTNKSLDTHYEQLNEKPAVDGDTVELIVSRKPLDELTTFFSKIRPDTTWPGSNFYTDAVLHEECWLCPFTTVLWGEAPETIYIWVG